MKDVIDFIKPLVEQQTQFVLGTVLKTWGSAPRKMGAHMVITENGQIAGSVSGGCVEGDVANRAKEVMGNGVPQILSYGVTNEDAWTVGLSCGGKIDVYLEPFFHHVENDNDANFWARILDCIEHDRGGVIEREISLEKINRKVHIDQMDHSPDASQAIAERKHRHVEHESHSLFYEILPPRSKLILIGASHIAVDLVHFAHQLDFETIVIDPRGFFTERTKYKTPPDQVFNDWPAEVLPHLQLDHFTYVVTLTHDPKIDDQALQLILPQHVAYIGALGSSRTHAKRVARLMEAGFEQKQVDLIHGPVGLNIHAQSAQEIALSVIAEIVAVKNQFV